MQTQKIEMDSRRQRSTVCVCTCTCLQACVLIATVREPLSDRQLIGHLTSTEEAARKLAKKGNGLQSDTKLLPVTLLSIKQQLKSGKRNKNRQTGENGEVIVLLGPYVVKQ